MKSHLVFSSAPIGSGSRVETLCGTEVENSLTVAVWDETVMMTQISWPLGTCKRCLKAVSESQARTYVYAVSEKGLHA